MDKRLIATLACPLCHGKLHYHPEAKELVCRNDAMAFPIRDGIPVMLADEARVLSTDERLQPEK